VDVLEAMLEIQCCKITSQRHGGCQCFDDFNAVEAVTFPEAEDESIIVPADDMVTVIDSVKEMSPVIEKKEKLVLMPFSTEKVVSQIG